jgi:hypothetical protein
MLMGSKCRISDENTPIRLHENDQRMQYGSFVGFKQECEENPNWLSFWLIMLLWSRGWSTQENDAWGVGWCKMNPTNLGKDS